MLGQISTFWEQDPELQFSMAPSAQIQT